MSVIEDVVPTVRGLLARTDLNLRLVGAATPEALEHEVRWVHSSDLVDPTPFLADDLVLLTTGTQFDADDGHEVVAAYVRRLVSRGVLALGFGTEVVRDGVPAALVAACHDAELPLFEVPYGTPFIALARANSEAVAAQAYARRSWALAAQRAISLAALRPDGLGATLAELAKQLGTWVGLYDAAGTLTREHPMQTLSAAARLQLEAEVAHVLGRGARAASSMSIDSHPYTLQTLGRGGRLRGVIAIGSAELDQEGRGVVTAVIAMAGLALEQQQRVLRGRSTLRAGLVHSLVLGDPTLARRVAREIGTPLPPAPVRVAVAEGLGRDVGVLDRLDLLVAEHPGAAFFGRLDDDLLILVPATSDIPADLTARDGVRVGVSEPGAHTEVEELLTQARAALRAPGAGVHSFAEVRASGMFADPSPATQAVAHALLAPLLAHDEAEGTALTATLREFLSHDGSHESTAAALGVHRHTVRARVQLAEKVLGRDLRAFPQRAELWAAFAISE